MNKRAKMFLAVFIMIVIVLTITLSMWSIQNEKEMDIKFEVDRVEITPALRAIYYDKDSSKLRLQRYVFFDYHDVKPGDLIVKDKGSEVLRVYRIDSLGSKSIILTMNLK